MVSTKKRRNQRTLAELAAALPGARRQKLEAKPFAPQLAKLVSKSPTGERWIHELKWDGYRLVATVVDGKASLWSRNALPWAAKVPAVVKALERLKVVSAAFDGELIAGGGRQQDFNLLQAVLSGERSEPLVFVLFDFLHIDGISLEAVALHERKALDAVQRLALVARANVVYSRRSSAVAANG